MKASKTSLFLRLGAIAGLLLFGQQALAIGTAAGTQIDNTVTVDYDVNGIDQTDLQDSVGFVVDRRVDFSLDLVGGALVDVTPGQQDAFFDLLLTNDSNSPLDFSIVLDQAGVTTVRGVGDTADMDNAEYSVSAVFDGVTPPAGTGGDQFVDELPADAAVIIRVYGDAALTLLNGQVAGIDLSATAGEPGGVGVEGAALVDGVANTDLGVENVFADADNDGVESETDGFNVVSAALTVTKSYAVVAGDLGSGLPIPGATIEYTISVVNGSATQADDVLISDVMDTADLGAAPFVLNNAAAPYLGEDIYVDNGGTQVTCDIEAGPADDCDFTDPNLTIGGAGFNVGGNATLTIQYQVVIPDPDPTP